MEVSRVKDRRLKACKVRAGLCRSVYVCLEEVDGLLEGCRAGCWDAASWREIKCGNFQLG